MSDFNQAVTCAPDPLRYIGLNPPIFELPDSPEMRAQAAQAVESEAFWTEWERRSRELAVELINAHPQAVQPSPNGAA